MLKEFYFSLLALFATITMLTASGSNSETGTVPASCDLGDVTTTLLIRGLEGHLPFYVNFNKFRAINLAKTIDLLPQYIVI